MITLALTDGSHTFKGPSGAAMMRVVFEKDKCKKAIKVPCTTAASAEAYLFYTFGRVNVIQCDEPTCNPELGVTLSFDERQAMIKDSMVGRGMKAWLGEKEKEVFHGDSLAAGIERPKKARAGRK